MAMVQNQIKSVKEDSETRAKKQIALQLLNQVNTLVDQTQSLQ
jgi:hypothetical protein